MPSKKNVNTKALHLDEQEAFAEISDILKAFSAFKSDFERDEVNRVQARLNLIRDRLISTREAFDAIIPELYELDEIKHSVDSIRSICNSQDPILQKWKADVPLEVQEENVVERSLPFIEESLRGVVKEIFHNYKEPINAETSFIDDMGADSLNMVELVVHVEESFDLIIPNDFCADNNWKTFQQCADYIRVEKQKSKKKFFHSNDD